VEVNASALGSAQIVCEVEEIEDVVVEVVGNATSEVEAVSEVFSGNELVICDEE
jgi:hypothetical protein